jgi:pyruvate/2-oxoglutarate dehydrogenase complex dihydrolipoamide acyltransferase (E2) component
VGDGEDAPEFPSQNVYYDEIDGKPAVVAPAHINLGIAIDLPEAGWHPFSLVVPGIKRTETMGFGEFLAAYEDVVRAVVTTSSRWSTTRATRSRSPTPAASAPSTPCRAS